MIIADRTAMGLLKIILTQLDYSYEQISKDTKLTPSKFGMVISGNRNYNTREWLKIITQIDERIETKKDSLIEMDELESVQRKVKKFRGKIFNIVSPNEPMSGYSSNYIEKPYINTLLGYVNTSPSDCLTKVVGPPKSGKTLLLKRFTEKLVKENLGLHCSIDLNSLGFQEGSNVPTAAIIKKIVDEISKEFPRVQLPPVHKSTLWGEGDMLKDWLKECFTLFYDTLRPKENLFLILDNLDGIYLYQEKSEITKTEAVLNHLLKVTLYEFFEENTNKNIFAVISFAALMKSESNAVESSDLDLHTTQFVNIDYFTKEDIDYMLELIGCSKKINYESGQSVKIRESLLKLYHGNPYLTSNALFEIFKSETEEYDEKEFRHRMTEYEDNLWRQSVNLFEAQIRTLKNSNSVNAKKIIDDFIEGATTEYSKYSHLLQKLFIEHLGKGSARFPEYILDANKRYRQSNANEK